MGVIIGARRTTLEDAVGKAEAFAPYLWAHRRAMLWWRKLNAVDQQTAKRMFKVPGAKYKSWEWIGSYPMGVATYLSSTRPEIFFDRTGKAAIEFLRSEEGAPYRVPGNKVAPI